MKSRKLGIILSISICLLAFLIILIKPKYTRVLEYGNHKIKYSQYLFDKEYLHPGHYVNNEDNLNRAYMKLANKLVDEYIEHEDPNLESEILRIASNHNLNIRGGLENITIDSLINNRAFLLDTILFVD